jgi:hypothetical protein
VLRVNGYAAIQSGSMVKIVPEATAQQDWLGRPRRRGRPHETDELVTQIDSGEACFGRRAGPILRRCCRRVRS